MTLPVTISGTKRRLPGLEGWLAAAARCVVPYDDAEIERIILPMIREFETQAKFRVMPVQVYAGTRAHDDAAFPGDEGTPRIRTSALPFFREEMGRYFRFTLPEKPVREVQRVRLFLGRKLIHTFPPEWHSVDSRMGEFHLLPVEGSLQYAGGQAAILWVIAQFGPLSYVPDAIHVDYVAGLEDGWEETAEWAHVVLHLEERCARKVLEDISELVDAGKVDKTAASDGLSQTVRYERFMRRKQELAASIERFTEDFRKVNAAFSLASL